LPPMAWPMPPNPSGITSAFLRRQVNHLPLDGLDGNGNAHGRDQAGPPVQPQHQRQQPGPGGPTSRVISDRRYTHADVLRLRKRHRGYKLTLAAEAEVLLVLSLPWRSTGPGCCRCLRAC
jgi:hypothetical protein